MNILTIDAQDGGTGWRLRTVRRTAFAAEGEGQDG